MTIKPENKALKPNTHFEDSVDLNLIRNRPFMLLWSSQTISSIGDPFFNIAVIWVIYIQSGSALQTAAIQVFWHLSKALFGPFAGILADHGNRKHIIVICNFLAAIIVSIVASVLLIQGQVSPLTVFIAVFLVNTFTTFLGPAHFSIIPEIVNRHLLATASGWIATAKQVTSLLGSSLAGVVIATAGSVWAVVIDAVSFLIAGLCIAVAQMPEHTRRHSDLQEHPSWRQAIMEGWKAIAQQPVVRVLVWLGMLINVSSLLGPLYPVLVDRQLNGGATAYGILEAAGLIGGIAGGTLAGKIERHLGAGHVLIAGWFLAGLCTLGIAASTWLPLTVALEAALVFGLTTGGVSLGTLTQGLIPEQYLGRVSGITTAFAVVAIPVSTLIGGWLADRVGPAPLFTFGGAWILFTAGLAWANRHVRTARI